MSPTRTETGAGSGKRGEYRKSAQRRAEILAAAMDVFARVGFRNSTLREIADGAGLTVPGVTHHYPTREAILEAVFETRDIEAYGHLEGREGVDALRGLLEIATRDEADPDRTRLFAIVAAEGTAPDHPAHEYFRGRYARVVEEVTRAFTHAQSAGLLRDGVDPAFAARSYISASDGIQLQWLYDASDMTQSTFLRHTIEQYLTEPL